MKTVQHECSTNISRRETLVWLAALGIGADATTPALAQDAAKAEPRSYKVVFENAKVRVLQYVSRPGLGVCGTGKHSHPDHVVVTLTPAKVKVTGEDGKVQINDIPAGATFWDPATTHSAENIGGSGSKMVLIEIKDKDWKPATG
jgi:hypothetical protein